MKRLFAEYVLPLLIALILLSLLCSGIRCACAADAPPGYTSPARVLASVRIGKRGGCSGTIIAIDGNIEDTDALRELDNIFPAKNLAYGLSAAHCASGVGKEFTFGNPDGSEGRARWAAIDRRRDLALFVCWGIDVKGVAKVCGDHTPDWSQATEAVGYPATRGPKWKVFRYRGEATINRRMQRLAFRNHGPGVFTRGDSGGGVFYDGNWLVGVMTHGGRSATAYCATHKQIVEFLNEHRGKFDSVEPFQNWGGNNRRPGWVPKPNIPVIPKPDRDEEKERQKHEIERLKKDNAKLAAKIEEIEKNAAATLDAAKRAGLRRESDYRQEIDGLQMQLKAAASDAVTKAATNAPKNQPAKKESPWVIYAVAALFLLGGAALLLN